MQSTLKSAQCVECGDGPRLLDDPFVLVVQSIRKYATRFSMYHIIIIILS